MAKPKGYLIEVTPTFKVRSVRKIVDGETAPVAQRTASTVLWGVMMKIMDLPQFRGN